MVKQGDNEAEKNEKKKRKKSRNRHIYWSLQKKYIKLIVCGNGGGRKKLRRHCAKQRLMITMFDEILR